jgi:hypothetical protein
VLNSTEIVGVRVNQGHPGATVPCLGHVARGRVDGGRRPDDHDEVDGALVDELVDLVERVQRKYLVEPDDAWAEQALDALGAVRKVGKGDGGGAGLEVCRAGGQGGGEALVRGAVDGEAGVKRVFVVVLLDVVTAEAFNIKQSTMQKLKLLAGVVRALGEAWVIVRDGMDLGKTLK